MDRPSVKKLKESTSITRKEVFKALKYVFKSIVFLLALLLIIISTNSIIVWNADDLPVKNSLTENRSDVIEVYDYPAPPNSDQNILFNKDVKVVSNSTYESDSTFLSSVNESSNSTYIRKYDADKQIIVTKYPAAENVQHDSKTVLWESVTYLSENSEDTYTIERRTVLKQGENNEMIPVNGDETACSNYRFDKEIYQVEFEDTLRDTFNLYLPSNWSSKAEDQGLKIDGRGYYNVSPPEHVNGYFLSDHKGRFEKGTDGSEYIEIDQSIRMVPDNPILTLTPIALRINIEHQYNRQVGSDISGDFKVEEPEWVDEADDCFATT